MAYHTGLVRIPSTWKTIRGELAQFMLDVQNKNEWQEACAACQDVCRQQPEQQNFSGSRVPKVAIRTCDVLLGFRLGLASDLFLSWV